MADSVENSPLSEEEEVRSRMPPRDPSLDDFEKLENFITRDKNEDFPDTRDILGESEKKSNRVADAENNPAIVDLLGDFNSDNREEAPYRGPESDGAPPPYDSHLPRDTHRAYEDISAARLSAEKSVLADSEKSVLAEPVLAPIEISPPPPAPEPEDEKPTKIASSFVDAFEQTTKETPLETTTSRRDKYDMSTEVSSSKPSTGCAGCPFSPSALFDPNRLHPVVTSLVYWKDPKKSGIVFGVSLLFLISLRYFSFISVVSYLALAVISITLSFRIYKNVLQAVQKSGEGHPFKEILEIDISVPQEKIHETADTIVGHAVTTIVKLRSMFLVEDLVDSIKLGIVLWCLTYLGAWFNGLTLITLGFIAIFSLPKVYETNKAQIDQYLNLVNSHICGVIATIKSKIPFGQKEKSQ